MPFWIFAGLFTNTTSFGSTFNSTDAGYIAFGDDETSPATGGGPAGDPRETFTASVTGWYTVAVTDYNSSNTSRALWDFKLKGTGIGTPAAVPEPSSVALVGLALTALAFVGRRRRHNGLDAAVAA